MAAEEHDLAEIDRKLNDIRLAQDQGLVDRLWDPADLLAMVAALAGVWANVAEP